MLNRTLLLVLMVMCNTVLAYEPEAAHDPLVSTALKIYAACFDKHNPYKSESAVKRIVQGDVAMDKGLKFNLFDWFSLKGERVFSITKRPLNWHFYNPNLVDLSKVGKVEQSHKNLWKGLKKGFEINTNDHNKLLFIGGIIHLIEDLTVPAHVVPVYHGPTAIKIYGPKRLKPLVAYMQDYSEEFSIKIPDQIDSISPNVKKLEEKLLNNNSVCVNAMVGSDSIDNIRLLTAQNTLSELDKPIQGCPDVIWGDFWLKPKENQYFGRYNIVNDNPLFGEAGLLHSSDDKTCKFEEDDDRYRDFVFSLHLNAIEADMKVLYWANGLMNDKK